MANRSTPDYMRTYRQTHKAEIRTQRLAYYERTGLPAARRWRAARPHLLATYRKTWRAKHPERYRAHNAVGVAIQTGRIPPARELPCFDCGGPAKDYDHYLGYEPEHHLDVQPVCRKCHGLRRRATNDSANTSTNG